jgi:hypothetical protein
MILQIVAAVSVAAIAHAALAHVPESVTFRASNGQVIQLNAELVMPGSKAVPIQDCGDQSQFCLTDGQGFAFSYFRNCADVGLSRNYDRLKFPPKIVSALHGDIWMVFDASPHFMFHYVEPTGLVGIYVGEAPTFDFRSLLKERALKMSDYGGLEYRIVPPGAIAACK